MSPPASMYPNGETSALSQPVSFKITHQTQGLARRLRFPTPPTFDALQSKLVSLWATSGLTASCLALSYLDSDGDRVVLSSDAELQDFFEDIRHRGVEGEVVKMRVLILGQEGTGGGGDREEATMDVEVEAAGAEDKEIEPVATVVEPAATRSEDAQMSNSDDPFADQNKDSGDFVLVDTSSPSDTRRHISMTPFGDDEDEEQLLASSSTPIVAQQDPPTAILVDDTVDTPYTPVAQLSPTANEDPDPEEIFPPAPEPQAAPPPPPSLPAMFSDIAQVFNNVAATPAFKAAFDFGEHSDLNFDEHHVPFPPAFMQQAERFFTKFQGVAQAFQEGMHQVEEVRRQRAAEEREREQDRAEKERDKAGQEREKQQDRAEKEREDRERERERAEAAQEQERERAEVEKEKARQERNQELLKKQQELDRAREERDKVARKETKEREAAFVEFKKNTRTAPSTPPTAPTPPTASAAPTPSTAPNHPYPYSAFGLNPVDSIRTFYSPPAGAPPPPPPSLFASSAFGTHPNAAPRVSRPMYSGPPSVNQLRPQHRHSTGPGGFYPSIPGAFPGETTGGDFAPEEQRRGGAGGLFGGSRRGRGDGLPAEFRVEMLGAKLGDMGFQKDEYLPVLRELLAVEGGKTDEEVVIEVVRRLVAKGGRE